MTPIAAELEVGAREQYANGAYQAESKSCCPMGIGSLCAVLEQLRQVVADLSDAQYTQKPVGTMLSSLGEHVRHCIDHVRGLPAAPATEGVDYEYRDRGGKVETDRRAAVEELTRLIREISLLPTDHLPQPVTIHMMVTVDDPPQVMRSTLEREIVHVLSHTIHHNAIIGAMVLMLGGKLPQGFGYAPSTIAYLRDKACAP